MSSNKGYISFEKNLMEDGEDILQKFFQEYVSLYHIELNSGKYEILRLATNTNARKIAGKGNQTYADFDAYTSQYARSFILEEDREEFLDWHFCQNMKKRLRENDKITYHYHSVSKEGTDSYYEALAVKGKINDKKFHIFLGYRNVDGILYKEKAIQEKLQQALNETRLNNEIICAIARTYQYISRIDIEGDWFEEIANKNRKDLSFGKSGIVSVNNKKSCVQFIAEEYQDAFLKFTDITTLPDRMKNEETIAMEYRMKNGDWHKLRFIEKKRDDTGKLTHVLCVIRSVSDAKKKEQDLLHQVAEARKDAALKTRFLSNMSHDIRTPLNGIMGMLNLADCYPNDPDMQQKCRNKVRELSQNLVSLVNDILDMNKLESDDFIEQELTFDLTELLNRANAGMQRIAEDKHVEYVVDWNRSNLKQIYLVGNPVYLERLLGVIADNAVKFTNPGGCIRVWCAEKATEEEKVVYEFGCMDNGIGMSEEFLQHAFDMFSQENETSRTTYEGTGLGLAIAKKIAERMSGTIEIKSQKGRGTTVLMTVPFKIGKETILKEKADSHKEVTLEGLRVLVAEDNGLNMEIVKFILEEKGISVECANDGLDVVKKFEKSAPDYYDVILMDIMMPDMNGWDATRKIRSMRRTDAAKIPIIAMSANAFAEDIINSRISGMNRHLSKPLDADQLLDTIRKCIAKSICTRDNEKDSL